MLMTEQQGQSGNYDYEIPSVLNDSNWRKCFENESQNKIILMEGIISIRKYLSQETEVNHLIKVVLGSEIHKSLFRYAKRLYEKISSGESTCNDVVSLHELIWIFTNLCSGSKQTTVTILELGIVNFCKDLFNLYKYEKIISILFELIGNLGGELSLFVKISFLADPRFYYFMKNCYFSYVDLQNFHANATWAFSNLFRDMDCCQDKNCIENLQGIILGYYPIIESLLQIENAEAILSLLHIFNNVSRSQNFHMIETLQIIERFLIHDKSMIRKFVIQIIGNYIAACDEAVDYALNHPHFLNVLFQQLNPQQNKVYRKQAAWILSNIFAGTVEQVEKIVSVPTLFNRLYEILMVEENEAVLKQFIWSVSNSVTSCSQVKIFQIQQSFEIIFGSCIIEPLSGKMMSCQQKSSFRVYLQGVENFLKKFRQNPNLPFNIFQQNMVSISPVLSLAEHNYEKEADIGLLIYKIRDLAQELMARGPITEEQLAKIHLEKFTI